MSIVHVFWILANKSKDTRIIASFILSDGIKSVSYLGALLSLRTKQETSIYVLIYEHKGIHY